MMLRRRAIFISFSIFLHSARRADARAARARYFRWWFYFADGASRYERAMLPLRARCVPRKARCSMNIIDDAWYRYHYAAAAPRGERGARRAMLMRRRAIALRPRPAVLRACVSASCAYGAPARAICDLMPRVAAFYFSYDVSSRCARCATICASAGKRCRLRAASARGVYARMRDAEFDYMLRACRAAAFDAPWFSFFEHAARRDSAMFAAARIDTVCVMPRRYVTPRHTRRCATRRVTRRQARRWYFTRCLRLMPLSCARRHYAVHAGAARATITRFATSLCYARGHAISATPPRYAAASDAHAFCRLFPSMPFFRVETPSSIEARRGMRASEYSAHSSA